MKSRILLAAVAFLGYAIIDGPAANAQMYFDGNNGADDQWSDAANWDSVGCNDGTAGSVPGSGDHAVICTNLTATIDEASAVAQKVTVEIGADVSLAPTASAHAILTLGDGAADQTSSLTGDINLGVPNGSFIAKMTFDPTYGATRAFHHTFTGTGSIIGAHTDAEIAIPEDNNVQATVVTLTINDAHGSGLVRIKGAMRITGPGDFLNDGAVIANIAGTLDLVNTGSIDDMSGDTAADPRWEVESNASAILRFPVEPAALEGRFKVAIGTLRAGDDEDPGDAIDVVTAGALEHTSGKIIAGEDDSFVFNGS